MEKKIFIQISDNPEESLNPTTAELVRIYNLLDHEGMLNVLTTAYSERIRMKQEENSCKED